MSGNQQQENNIQLDSIVDAIEDIRIDNKAFGLLPNVYDFYKQSVKDHTCTKKNKENIDKQHLLTRCMIQAILYNTNFNQSTYNTGWK